MKRTLFLKAFGEKENYKVYLEYSIMLFPEIW